MLSATLNTAWVALFWEPAGDEAMYDDGAYSGCGNWWGYLKFIEHPRVRNWIKGYNLGSSDTEATHCLLCDLKEKDAFIAGMVEARNFLLQELKQESPDLSLDEIIYRIDPDRLTDLLKELREDLKEIQGPSCSDVEAKIRQDQMAVDNMLLEMSYL